MEVNELSREDVLAATPSVPDHVVYRAFVNETVVLNLQTGAYHGLNPSGAAMLERLATAETVRAAAAALAEHYRQPLDQIEPDLCEFCLSLQERGLLVLSDGDEPQDRAGRAHDARGLNTPRGRCGCSGTLVADCGQSRRCGTLIEY